jgi:Zn-dependent protease with chaperone function
MNELAAGGRLLHGSEPVTLHSNPRAWRVWCEVGAALDVHELPPLHRKAMGGVNAATTGMDRPIVLVSDETLSRVHDGVLRAVLAHELGHILSGHIRYKTAWMFLATLGASSLPALWTIPVYAGAFAAFRAWDRASELSADRASLLVTGEVDMLAVPLAGRDGPLPGRRLREWAGRSAWSERMEPVIDGGWRALQAHPPGQARLDALRTWAASDTYAAILDGRYARRGDEKKQAGRWLEARAATLREGWASAMAAFEERSRGS